MFHVPRAFFDQSDTVSEGWKFLNVFNGNRPTNTEFDAVKLIAVEYDSASQLDTALLDWLDQRFKSLFPQMHDSSCISMQQDGQWAVGECSEVQLPTIVEKKIDLCPEQTLTSVVGICKKL